MWPSCPCKGKGPGHFSTSHETMGRVTILESKGLEVLPGKLTWNLKIIPLKGKIIFQTSIFRFHVNLPGCKQKSTPKHVEIFFQASALPATAMASWSNFHSSKPGKQGVSFVGTTHFGMEQRGVSRWRSSLKARGGEKPEMSEIQSWSGLTPGKECL